MSLKWNLVVSFLIAMSAQNLAFGDEEAQKALHGRWLVKSIQHSGAKLPAKALAGAYTFKGDLLTTVMTLRAGRVTENYKIKLDTRKTPWTIDQTRSDGRFKGKAYLGIYKIEKNQVTLCMDARSQGKRPTEFLSSRSNGRLLVVLGREETKEEAKPATKKKETTETPSAGQSPKKLALEGTWRLVKGTNLGVELSLAEVKKQDMTLLIKGSQFFWKTSKSKTNGHKDTEFAMTIDWTKKPVHIDLKRSKGKSPMQGILKMEDRQLMLCLRLFGNKARPSKFESVHGQPYALFTFKREK